MAKKGQKGPKKAKRGQKDEFFWILRPTYNRVKNGPTGAGVWLATFDFLQPILKGRPKNNFKFEDSK